MSSIFPLTREKIKLHVKNLSGVYQIRCYNKRKPLVIGRLLNIDKLGILSIGSSSNIKQRLKQFIEGMKKGVGHSSGNRYYYLALDRKNMLGRYKLMFTINYTKDHEKEEARLLIGYADYFGELPPLNSQDIKWGYYKLRAKKYPKMFKW